MPVFWVVVDLSRHSIEFSKKGIDFHDVTNIVGDSSQYLHFVFGLSSLHPNVEFPVLPKPKERQMEGFLRFPRFLSSKGWGSCDLLLILLLAPPVVEKAHG